MTECILLYYVTNFIYFHLQVSVHVETDFLHDGEMIWDGFKVKGGSKGVTTGIWMWSKPFVMNRGGKKVIRFEITIFTLLSKPVC